MGMRKIWTVLIAVSLGLGLGACSKCEIPDLLPKVCKTGAGAALLGDPALAVATGALVSYSSSLTRRSLSGLSAHARFTKSRCEMSPVGRNVTLPGKWLRLSSELYETDFSLSICSSSAFRRRVWGV